MNQIYDSTKKRRQSICAITLALVLMLLVLCGCALQDMGRERVGWRDKAMGDAVAQALGRRSADDVFFDELDQVTQIVIGGQSQVNITDIVGLQNLDSVDLSDAVVQDYTPLLSLPKLKKLRVGQVDYATHYMTLGILQHSIADTDIDVDTHYWGKITVNFYDPVMENTIRKAIEMPTGQLTMADTRRLMSLSVRNENIGSLRDLAWCPLLSDLTLVGCQITNEDLAQIADLTWLRYLNLERNRITDISALGSLRNLQILSLGGNEVADAEPLTHMQALTEVYLSGKKPDNVQRIGEMTRLTALALNHMQLEDIGFLNGLTHLKKLYLDENKITDLTPLMPLEELEFLSLNTNRITDISALSGLTRLKQLQLGMNNIIDIKPLENLKGLVTLSLVVNNVMDVAPLTRLPKLTSLGMISNPVMDYAPLLDLQRDWLEIDVELEKAKEATDKAKEVAESIDKQYASPADKIKAVHDYVAHNTLYDHDAAAAGDMGFESQSLYASMIRGKAVCVGYAEAVGVMLMHMGIECTVVVGTGRGIDHAWNLVYIDNYPLYVDATWDDPDMGRVIYRDYLLVDAAVMRENHQWDEELYLRERMDMGA